MAGFALLLKIAEIIRKHETDPSSVAFPSSTILIFSAGFGDGHNSAARSVSLALRDITGGQVAAPVIDLFEESAPRFGAFLKWGYGLLTTRAPWGWKWIYDHADKADPSRLGWDMFGDMHRCLTRHLAVHKPRAVISTFPLYPHLLDDGHYGVARPRGKFTVVTDSITIGARKPPQRPKAARLRESCFTASIAVAMVKATSRKKAAADGMSA